MNIVGNINLSIGIDETLSFDGQNAAPHLGLNPTQAFANGTAANQCDLKWSHTSTLAAGSNDTYTLSALTDGLGRSVAFARVRAILIVPQSTVDGDDLAVGGAATHEWLAITGSAGQTYLVKSKGFDLKVAMNTTGFPVTASTSDQLKIHNSGANPITYTITLVGASV